MLRVFSFLFCILTMVACHSGALPEEAGTLPVPPQPETINSKAWIDFLAKNKENVLLDFSYVGYKHGEVAPPDVWTLGYKKYDMTVYGAIPNDGKSDRKAFMKILDEIGIEHHPDARAIIYFPEGEFILFDEEDKANGLSETLRIRAGGIILKGAGRNKTTISMEAPYPPLPNLEYAGPMIEFVHWSGFSPELPELIAEELYPYKWRSSMTQLQNEGVQIYDFHQVKSVHGNQVRFIEPIMHKVDKRWKWKLCRYNCYQNIGVEDLTFKGHAPRNFVHSNWSINSAYKPISFQRIANAWVRRVN